MPLINCKKKILLVIDSLTGGGAEKVLLNIARYLARFGHDVVVVLTLGKQIAYDVPPAVRIVSLFKEVDLRWEGKFLRRTIFPFDFLLRYFLSKKYDGFDCFIKNIVFASDDFAEFVNNEKPDCILSFLPNSNIITILSKKNHKWISPIICSDRNYISSEILRFKFSFFYKFFIRNYYKLAEYHVAVSDSCKNDLHEKFGINLNKIVTINNGVDIDAVNNLSQTPVNGFEIDSSCHDKILKIVTVGRLSVQKGHEFLLRAIEIVNRQVPCCLVLIGEGELDKPLKKITVDLGIEEIVYFLGWQQNPHAVMARCDLFVLSSLWEGFPNVLLEAMAVGLPVVSTRCPSGPEEILDEGNFGLLVPLGDPGALAKAILRLADPEFRGKQSLLAQQRCAHYYLEGAMKKYSQLLSRVISNNG